MRRSGPAPGYAYPPEWWWTLLRMAGQLIQGRDGGRQLLGWALLGICEVFAPADEWFIMVRSGQRRVLREAPVRASRPHGALQTGESEHGKHVVQIDRDAYEAFHDLSHLSLPEHLADRRGGRRRRRRKATGEFLQWWRRYGE